MKAGSRNVVIWVDADAAPREVKEILFRASTRRELEMVLVANSPQPIPKAAAHARSVLVRQGADVADRYIVQHSQARDIAITADIPLAAALVEKEVVVIDPRGDEFSAANISARLSMRDFMDDLRGQGVMTSGAAPYTDRDKQAFASTFDRLLTRLLRQP